MDTLLPLTDDAATGLNTELGGKVLFLPGLSFGEVNSEKHHIAEAMKEGVGLLRKMLLESNYSVGIN